MANQEIRSAAHAAGVRHWQIADFLNVSEGTLVRWLRRELTEEKRAVIVEAIQRIKKGGGAS